LAIEKRVKQALLRSAMPDGSVILLVVLHDDRCAILRNNDMIHEAAGDADGIDGAVQRFMVMTQVTDVLGAEDETPDAAAATAPEPTTSSAPRSELTRNPASATVAPPASPRSSAAPGTSV